VLCFIREDNPLAETRLDMLREAFEKFYQRFASERDPEIT
jgi:hypothetical protein